MCFVIELQHPRVPLRIGVNPPSGKGIVLRQEGVSLWRRELQYDADGVWILFFGPHPLEA